MLAIVATIVLVPLIYLPGLLVYHALAGAAQPPDLLERHYERTVVGALLNGWLALVLAELGLFAIWLHVLLLVCICVVAGLVGLWRGDLRLPGRPLGIVARPGAAVAWPQLRAQLAAHWDALIFVVVGLVFVALVTPPFEVVLGARDAGVYANTGYAIARTGAIVQHDALLAQIGLDQQSSDPLLQKAAEQAETNLLGVQHPERTIATRLRAAGFYINAGELAQGRVVPQFFHLFPAWIALLTGLLGLQGGLLATGLLGLLGLWSVGMLGRRLAGRWVGALAVLLLALNGVQIWFSRYSTSESTAQFLVFAGFYGFAVMQSPAGAATRPLPPAWLARRAAVAGLLAGVAFGQLALAHLLYAIVVIPPVLAYLFYCWLTRRWVGAQRVLAGGLLVLLVHAAVHVVTIARAYFFDTLYARLQDYALTALLALPFLTTPLQGIFWTRKGSTIGIRLGPGVALVNTSRILTELALLALAIVLVLAVRRWGQPWLAAAERAFRRVAGGLLWLGLLGIIALAAYGYLVRPQILSPAALGMLPGCLVPAQVSHPSGACLALQSYVGAPIAPAQHPDPLAYGLASLPTWLRGQPVPERLSEATRLDDTVAIVQANMVRLGWYLSPLGMVLAVAGYALWWRRGMNYASWLFLMIGLVTTVFFVRQTYGSGNQTYIYILRRYVPHVYPTLCLAIAYALVALGRWRPGSAGLTQRAPLLAAGMLALALLAFLVATGRSIAGHVEYGGALDQLRPLAGRFAPGDVLLLRGGDHSFSSARDKPDLLVTPLTYGFGLDAWTIKSKNPGDYADQLARYATHWLAQGRRVYLVLGASGAVGLPGLQLEPAGRIALDLAEFEQLTNQKPTNIQRITLDYAVYQVVPAQAAPPQPSAIAVDDFAYQLRGFYTPEQVAGRPLAWTDGEAVIGLPWPSKAPPRALTLQLAAGKRPAVLGPAQACVAFRAEASFRAEQAAPEAAWSVPQCVSLTETMAAYHIAIEPPASAPATGRLLMRLTSPAWVPAQTPSDPPSADARQLGVQFGGLTMEYPH